MPINMNRFSVIRNPYQNSFRKVLAVCSGGVLRSPTIAWLLSQAPYNYNTRSCGISAEYALIPIDEALVVWADEIVCANSDHHRFITKNFTDLVKYKPVFDLGIPDTYSYRDPELIKRIQEEYGICYDYMKTGTEAPSNG